MGKTYFQDWGVTEYNEAWKKQEVLFDSIMDAKKAVREGKADPDTIDHYIVFVEHPHVYTLGKSGSENNLLINAIQLQARHAAFVNTNRGGDITYHGPGQIVGYPILDLEALGLGLKQYIHLLEESIILSIAEFGIEGSRLDGATGVWLEPDTKKARKICAIGVKSSRYVTMHGFALNINTQLEYFNYINPCGFIDKGVTSVQKELGREIDFNEAKKIVKKNIEKVFGFNLI
ncbi:lipoyl(octanoyl) transferase LipB [Saccharicrinis sp. FJH54]|uniref:lipoyl(octanoyl) transferase LipB n=1 Tax=Saccharicrinis sp. FJH54 TaxID=3344665 RepID=UPI0035D3F086